MGVYSRPCFRHSVETHCRRFVPFAEQSSGDILSLYALCPKASCFWEACSAYPVQKISPVGCDTVISCALVFHHQSPHPGLGSLSGDVGVSSVGVLSLVLVGWGAAISRALIEQMVVNIWPLQ